MVISGTFRITSDVVIVVVDNENLIFMDSNNNIGTLDGLKFSYQGVVMEFPDLKDNDNWKKIALERLKEKIKGFKSEMERLEYVKDELVKFGYEPLYYQVKGWRQKKFT